MPTEMRNTKVYFLEGSNEERREVGVTVVAVGDSVVLLLLGGDDMFKLKAVGESTRRKRDDKRERERKRRVHPAKSRDERERERYTRVQLLTEQRVNLNSYCTATAALPHLNHFDRAPPLLFSSTSQLGRASLSLPFTSSHLCSFFSSHYFVSLLSSSPCSLLHYTRYTLSRESPSCQCHQLHLDQASLPLSLARPQARTSSSRGPAQTGEETSVTRPLRVEAGRYPGLSDDSDGRLGPFTAISSPR